MMTPDIRLKIRQATSSDATHLCRILNEIITIGGTTALETMLSETDLNEHYISGPDCIICFVAEVFDGEMHGFQTLVKNSELPDDWADIGTFTRREPLIAGIGTALFEYTKRAARACGLSAINATIRADNNSGIPYYDKLGFKTYKVANAVPLKDGTPVDRISKVYNLG
jgi:GNAT superfamily N-acetyltransferase